MLTFQDIGESSTKRYLDDLLNRIIVWDHVEAKRIAKNSPNEGENLLGKVINLMNIMGKNILIVCGYVIMLY